MDWINYHHLLYFWTVAREGGLVPAGKRLRLSHSTLSTQIRALEDQLGEPLFDRSGRRLILTETGKVAYRYAEEIFNLGREMVDTVQGRATGAPHRLRVGVADSVPKLVVRQLLKPALELPEPVHLVCHEDRHEKLLAELALHELHLVISDATVAAGSSVRAFPHLLGESGVTLFGTPSLVKRYRRGFPGSLDGAPMLLPLESLPLRRTLNRWFDQQKIRPVVVAEFEDSALAKVFGSEGAGLFAAPTAIEKEVVRRYGVKVLGRPEGVRERFYAITVERKLSHPAVLAISDAARHQLFA